MSASAHNVYLRAVALGVMVGMRSFSASWLLALRADREPGAMRGTPFGWLGYRQVLGLFSLMELGELIADKTPFVPSRIAPLPLLGRLALGGFAGAAALTEVDQPALPGAAAAAAGALASSFAFYHLRRAAVRATGLPDPVVALMEDATLAGLALAVMKTYR